METLRPANPFTLRGTIRDPQQFFGRHTEVQQIFDRLRTMQSVSVVGERRIGKSSLLYHIFQTSPQQLGPEVRVCYTDLPDVTDEAGFYGRLCQELGGAGRRFRDLEQLVQDTPSVFCIDEFEKVAGQAAFSRGFFDGLRSLAQSGNFALLVATQHSLADLCRTEQIATSPFWNIFSRLDLGLLSADSAEALIREPFTQAGLPVTQDELRRVLELAGRFPFFSQLACYHLFEAKRGGERNWPTAFERDADVSDALRVLWQGLTQDEQSAVRWVLEFSERLPADRVLWDLERRGLLVRDHALPAPVWVFSEVFEGLARNPPKPPPKKPWSISIKRFKITLWPPSIEAIDIEGNRSK